jgi:hypothetical protein
MMSDAFELIKAYIGGIIGIIVFENKFLLGVIFGVGLSILFCLNRIILDRLFQKYHKSLAEKDSTR